MRYKDDDGEEGRYSGYVNAESKPHGRGKCVYDNGTTFKGEWCEGSKVHGKTSWGKSKKSTEKGKEKEKAGRKHTAVRSGGEKAPPEKKINEKKKQEALKQYKELYNTEAPVVKNMIFGELLPVVDVLFIFLCYRVEHILCTHSAMQWTFTGTRGDTRGR